MMELFEKLITKAVNLNSEPCLTSFCLLYFHNLFQQLQTDIYVQMFAWLLEAFSLILGEWIISPSKKVFFFFRD